MFASLADALLPRAYSSAGSYHPGDDTAAMLWGRGDTASGVDVSERTALNIAAVYCAYTLISDAIKMLPLFTYKRIGSAGKEADTKHPVYKLLHRTPNPNMGPARFKKLMGAWTILWGNGRAEIQRNGRGEPIALWPIHPSRVSTYRDGKTVVHAVRNEQGSLTEIDDANMLHTMGDSDDGVCGLSVIGKARESLGLTVAAEQYGARFFKNDATPRVVLEHPQKLGELAAKRLRESWQKAYGGENQRGVAVTEEGIKTTVLSMPNEDAQFLESREFQTVEVARWFNIPPHKLKDLTRATFSNIEHLSLEYVGDTIMPYLVDFEEECDRKLLEEPERETHFCEFLVDAMLRADAKARAEAFAIRRQWGTLTANEWRAKENDNPIAADEGGDDYIVPNNFTTLDRMSEGPPPLAVPSSPAPALPAPKQEQADSTSRVGNKPVLAGGPDATSAAGTPSGGAPSAIEAAHRIVLSDAWRRMLAVEKTAAERAARKHETFAAWVAEFYQRHAIALRGALIPGIESLATCIRPTLAKPSLDAEWERFSAEFLKNLVETHVGSAVEWFAREGANLRIVNDSDADALAAATVDDFLADAKERFA